MIRATNIAAEFAATEIKAALIGRRCWYVYGQSVGTTFQMALGRKVRRERELRNKHHPLEYRRFKGESNLLVWCSWRLEESTGPLASSDNDPLFCERALRRLIGKPVQSVEISPSWNLQLSFTGGFMLSVFPDHVGPEAIFDGNWELWRPDQAYLIGTGLTCEVIDRENRPLRLQTGRRWVAAPVSPKKRRTVEA